MSKTTPTDDRRNEHNNESAGWRTEYAAAAADLPDDVPTTADLADRLDVTTRRLDRFVEFHPKATAAGILGFAVADPKHRDAVEAWLADRRRQREARRVELDTGEIPDDLRTVNSGWYREGSE